MKKSTTSKMKPSMMEGSSAAQMMKKFGGAAGAPSKQVGGERAYAAVQGKKKGVNKGS